MREDLTTSATVVNSLSVLLETNFSSFSAFVLAKFLDIKLVEQLLAVSIDTILDRLSRVQDLPHHTI